MFQLLSSDEQCDQNQQLQSLLDLPLLTTQ